MRTLILGAAVSGVAAAHLAARLGHEVAVYDRSSGAVSGLRDEGFTVHSGTWARHRLDDVDLVVASPGFPEGSAPIREALDAGIRVVSELEFGARHLPGRYAAVTGTNGKTTTTNLITDMLNGSGVSAIAAGNIGTPVCGLSDASAAVFVLEASSFQLRFIEEFRPEAAGIVNIADDHLDWHGTTDAYARAKSRIYENMTSDDLLVFNADDPGATTASGGATCRTTPVSGTGVPVNGVGPRNGSFVVGDRRIALPTLDPSWVVDLVMAAVIAHSMGGTEEGISRVVAAFDTGPHRRRTVGTANGITWIDDSKATNPHAARAAAAAYESVILLAGGRNKGLDLSTLAPETVRHVIAFGEAGPSVAESVTQPVTIVADMASAVQAADRIARSGDTVLLAPGCASFDEFESYAVRGDRFAALVDRVEASK
jgi:UDP-N-acetylmuramoylalanine--D-glutamate ligase